MKRFFALIGILFLSLVFVSGQAGNLGVPTPWPLNPMPYNNINSNSIFLQTNINTTSFGKAVALVDINNDNKKDIIVASESNIFTFDSVTSNINYVLNPSVTAGGEYYKIAGIGDVNGNGLEDFAASYFPLFNFGLPLPLSYVVVEIYDGGGTFLYSINGPGPTPIAIVPFGNDIVGLGDVNGNQIPDFAVSAIRGGGTSPSVFIYEGNNGALLNTISSPIATGFNFGNSIAKTGDVTGDGISEIIVGDSSSAIAYVYNPASLSTGIPLFSLTVPGAVTGTNGGLGYLVAGDPNYDFNSDGYPDFVVGNNVGFPIIYIFSGLNGNLLTQFTISTSMYELELGNVNGDLFKDIVIGALSEMNKFQSGKK